MTMQTSFPFPLSTRSTEHPEPADPTARAATDEAAAAFGLLLAGLSISTPPNTTETVSSPDTTSRTVPTEEVAPAATTAAPGTASSTTRALNPSRLHVPRGEPSPATASDADGVLVSSASGTETGATPTTHAPVQAGDVRPVSDRGTAPPLVPTQGDLPGQAGDVTEEIPGAIPRPVFRTASPGHPAPPGFVRPSLHANGLDASARALPAQAQAPPSTGAPAGVNADLPAASAIPETTAETTSPAQTAPAPFSAETHAAPGHAARPPDAAPVQPDQSRIDTMALDRDTGASEEQDAAPVQPDQSRIDTMALDGDTGASEEQDASGEGKEHASPGPAPSHPPGRAKGARPSEPTRPRDHQEGSADASGQEDVTAEPRRATPSPESGKTEHRNPLSAADVTDAEPPMPAMDPSREAAQAEIGTPLQRDRTERSRCFPARSCARSPALLHTRPRRRLDPHDPSAGRPLPGGRMACAGVAPERRGRNPDDPRTPGG
ncbi:MAG: hypothetical protein KatS3mg044_0090 [Rhodothermaceae bacterium]|nr:MAG: hypothetical protein KatS3mg044_0090 [Rhodothermaceae bacterium]